MVEDYCGLLKQSLEAPRRAEPVSVEHSDGAAAMARFKAQLESATAAEEEEEPEAAAVVLGLAERINELFGDNSKPPPTTVWGRDFLKGSESGEA